MYRRSTPGLLVLATVLFAVLLEGAVPARADPGGPGPDRSKPAKLDKMDLWRGGTRLRGANIWQRIVVPDLDGPEFLGAGHVGPPYRQQDFDRLAALGANWVNVSGPGIFTMRPPYVLDREVAANLDRLLDMVARADMFAVITFRTGPGRSDFTFCREGAGDWFDEDLLIEDVWTEAAAQDAWVAMWREAARLYRGRPGVVGYDLMCEPNGPGLLGIWEPEDFFPEHRSSLADWGRLYPRIVSAIREVDPDTPILIGGMGWSAVRWLPSLEPVGDRRIVYAAHQYEPQDAYTHQEPGGRNAYPGRFDMDEDGSPEAFGRPWLEGLLAGLSRFHTRHGRPLTVNEFGVHRWVPGAERFMDDQLDILERLGVNHAMWAFFPSWPAFQEDDSEGFDLFRGVHAGRAKGKAEPGLLRVLRSYWRRNRLRPSSPAP